MRTLIPIVLLVLTGWFLVKQPAPLPLSSAAGLGGLQVDPSPLRPLDPSPGVIEVGGQRLRCTECHFLFESRPIPAAPLAQHKDVRLDHGANDNCLNCHDREDRGMLRSSNGKQVPLGEATLLCAGCHGPTWRDWQQGVHGRTGGSWDAASGKQTRLVCVECHDPHAPAIGGLPLFPGPHTLRMGPQRPPHGEQEGGRRNPLHVWNDWGAEHRRAADAPGAGGLIESLQTGPDEQVLQDPGSDQPGDDHDG